MKPLSKATAALFAPVRLSGADRVRVSVTAKLERFVLDCYQNSISYGETYKVAPSHQLLKLLQRLPDRKKVKHGYSPNSLEVAISDWTVALLKHHLNDAQLVFADEDAKLVFQAALEQAAISDILVEQIAAYKASATVPQHSYEYAAELPLSKYQQVALCCSMLSSGFGYGMEQGTGKTAPTIATICNGAKLLQQRLAEQGLPPRMYRAIVVCPNNVRMNWENETKNFATQYGRVHVIRGTEVNRFKQLIDAVTPDEYSIFTLVVIGYDTLARSIDVFETIDWDFAALDEAHYIRNPRTKRCKSAFRLRDKAAQRLTLSGTPICNSIFDLYAWFEFMGRGCSGFQSFEAYRKFYGVFDVDFESGHAALVGAQNLPFIKERLARYTYIVTQAEALPDLPPKVYSIVECEMSPQQSDCYEEMAESLAVEIEAELADDSLPRSMVVNNILTQLLRLAQITSGFMSWAEQRDDLGNIISPARIEYFPPPNNKIEAAFELFRSLGPDEKLIIWACWVPDIEYLASAAEQFGIDFVTYYGETTFDERVAAEYRFNNDDGCRLAIINAACGGTGLNLLGYPPQQPELSACDCTMQIFYSQNWSPVARQQAEARPHRRGTRRPVRTIDLTIPNTIDETIRCRVLSKKITALEISDIREILSNVLKGGIV